MVDTCEDVTICDPNVIVQDCLPSGEEQHCEYTILETVWPEGAVKFNKWLGHIAPEDPWYDFKTSYGNWIGEVDENGDPTHPSPVTFALEKWINGENPEYWVGNATGGDYNDGISGLGLLEFFNRGPGGNIASLDPSTYLGDLIYFNINGGAGDDLIEGANNGDILIGADGNDSVWGLGGDDSITGGNGADHLYGGDGNDLVSGGADNDCISGGNGDDGLTGGMGDDDVYGDAGNDNLTGGAGNDGLYGGDGDDWNSGGDGNDYMDAGAGNDCMSGGAGDDSMYGNDGDDRMLGDAGNDHMYGGNGNDKMDGGEGEDCVAGDDGDDLVDGGNGDDEVYGGNGDDIVRGGMGEDEVYGGDGCDTFAFCEVDLNCSDLIGDFGTGRDADRIDLSHLDIDSIRVELTGNDDNVRLDLLMGGDIVQTIFVQAEDEDTNLASVFDKDNTYGLDVGNYVQVAEGVLVDLPSTSVIFGESGLFF